MLNSDNFTEYLDMETGMLSEVVNEYMSQCNVSKGGKKKASRMQCLRMGGQMLQTSLFVSAAHDKMLKLPATSRRHIQERLDKASAALATLYGDDGDLILRLLRAMRTLHPASDSDALKKVTSTIKKLVGEDELAKEKARSDATEFLRTLSEKDTSNMEAASEAMVSTDALENALAENMFSDTAATADGTTSALAEINSVDALALGKTAKAVIVILCCMFIPFAAIFIILDLLKESSGIRKWVDKDAGEGKNIAGAESQQTAGVSTDAAVARRSGSKGSRGRMA
jgi:hypothetical protein